MGRDQGPESREKEPPVRYGGTQETVRGVKLGRDRVPDAVLRKGFQKVLEEQQRVPFGVRARGRCK